MARILKLDRKFYGDDGLLSLYRGDDWSFYGKVVDRVNGYETGVDLSAYSASAFFPSASMGCGCPPATGSAPSVILGTAVTGSCGLLTISLPAASTPSVQTNTGGEGLYVVLQDQSGNLQTVPTMDQDVVILDRGFPNG